MRSSSVLVLVGVAALSLPLACTERIVKVVPAETIPPEEPGSGDTAGTEPGPKLPEDVPVVALEASPDACAAAYRTKAPVEGLNTSYEVAGQQREFVLRLPKDTSTPRPLFVAFNGTGENGTSFTARAKLASFVERGFIVVAPSSAGNGSSWPVWDALRQPGKENDPNPDLDYFDSLVACVAAHHPVDKNRIYVGGHSAGGIFTNHVVQRRSSLLAGAVAASSVLSLTAPKPPEPLDPMFVIVTWGGDNDRYTGKAGDVSVGGFDFVTEASLASKFYDAQPNVGEVNCRGDDVGHAWLSTLNDWFVDQLLRHPKGLPGKGSADLAPAVPANARAKCSDAPYAGKATMDVVCEGGARAGCASVCQLFADCAVENGAISSLLKGQLSAIGFSGPNNESCGGCVAKCDEDATTASDAAALACFQTKQQAAQCGQGVEGAMPLVEAVNSCCAGRKDSPYCVAICKEIATSSAAATFFTTCAELAK